MVGAQFSINSREKKNDKTNALFPRLCQIGLTDDPVLAAVLEMGRRWLMTRGHYSELAAKSPSFSIHI
jgi:hypothetical protein